MDQNTTPATTADKIRAARKAAGLTQADLAEKAGVKTDTVGNWERGRIEPTLDRLRKIALVLGVAPGDLV